ncbi:MAG: PAC2 family protein [Phycisphaerae bacterium]|nr:PAC2 family protein [Phycisphaerae bacterium]
MKKYNNPRYYGSDAGHKGIMVAGFSDWVEDSDIGAGTIEYIGQQCGAKLIAEIENHDYYINSLPGNSELAIDSRATTTIADGLIQSYDQPINKFYYAPKADIVLFCGHEPQINWREYSRSFFDIIDKFRIKHIYNIAGRTGLTPHSRQPHISAYVSDKCLLEKIIKANIKLSNYTGTASINTYLTRGAKARDVYMTNLTVDIPPYIEGRNPKSIEAVIRCLRILTGIKIELKKLHSLIDELDAKLDVAVQDHEELNAQVKALEEYYDTNMFENDMGDLKTWLVEKGITLD